LNDASLDALARSLTGPFAFCGIAVEQGQDKHFAVSTGTGVIADADTAFRVASVSKCVTAAAFEAVARGAGLSRPFAVPASKILGLDLRHPRWPDTPVTLGQLMAHTAGLWDDGGYLFDDALSAAFNPSAMFSPAEPGRFFRYCNLDYILLAAAAERLSGRRFDRLVTDVLGPLGVAGAFNWVGMAEGEKTMPIYRHDGTAFVPQIDAPPSPANLTGYCNGEDTWRFSPQGGLRLSLRGMLSLADGLVADAGPPVWRTDDGPGDYLDGLMQDYGAGLQYLDRPHFYPRPLVGHFANAYGLRGGIWVDRASGLRFAYALNGFPVGDEDDALTAPEKQIFDTIAAI